MRYLHAFALAALIAAMGCGRSAVEKRLGVKVYPGARLSSISPLYQHDGKTICTATFDVQGPPGQVDEFYAKELGPTAVRTFRRSDAADTVAFTLDKAAGERITIGIIHNKQSATLLLIRHDLPEQ